MVTHSYWARFCRLLAASGIALLCAGWGAAQPVDSLTPHTAEYKVKISVVSGQLRTELAETDAGYVARHVIFPTGMSRLLARGEISETSEFSRSEGGFSPTAYQSDDTLSKDPTRTDIRFDWDAKQASGTVNDEQFVAELDGLLHDRVSIQYELMHDLKNGGAGTQYRLFDVDRQKLLNVRSIGSKQVDVPFGRFTAVGIQHQAENSSRVTTLWCVEELGYLPVIIEQHRNGKLRVQATLQHYAVTG